MGDGKRRMDILNERMDNLEQIYEIIRNIQKEQAVIMNILIRKAEVTTNDIDKETARLITELEKCERSIEPS